MKPDKKQTAQLVILGVLVVLFVGFLSFNFLAPKAGPKAAPAKPAQEATTGPRVSVEPEAGKTVEADASLGIFPDLASTPARRDPFIPQRLPGAEVEQTGNRHFIPPPRPINVFKGAIAKVPPIGIPPVNPFKTGPDAPPSAVRTVAVDDEPKFTVTGILRGGQNVVIIKSGDNDRYVVRQGDTIMQRYKVLYVTSDGVVLGYKNRRIHVKLGGDKNAS